MNSSIIMNSFDIMDDIIAERIKYNKLKSELDAWEKDLIRREQNISLYQQTINQFNDNEYIHQLKRKIIHDINQKWNWTGEFPNSHIEQYKIIIAPESHSSFALYIKTKNKWCNNIIDVIYLYTLDDCIEYIKTLCTNGYIKNRWNKIET